MLLYKDFSLSVTMKTLRSWRTTTFPIAYFIFLFNLIKNTQALDCFKCGLKESDNVICEDFDPGAVEYKEKCSNDVLSCIKVFGTYDNITAIGRKCGNAGSAPNLCSDMSLGGATVTICSCDQDYCNIATKLQIPYVFLLSLLFIASKRSVL